MFNARFSQSNKMNARFSSSAPMKANYSSSIAKPGSVIVPDISIRRSDTESHIAVNESGLVSFDAWYEGGIQPTVEPGIVDSVASGSLIVDVQAQLQLPTQAGKIVTPTTFEQTAVAAGKFTTGDVKVAAIVPFNPFGEGLELIATYTKSSVLLKNTSFNGWTPSTTAKTIQATANLGTQVLDLDNYEYMLKWIVDADISYANGTTLKGAPIRQLTGLFQYIYRKPSNLSNLASETDNLNYCTTLYTAPLMDYYNTSGTHTMAWTGSYGFYGAATAAGFSSTSSATPTLTIKRPTLNARCSTTYFTTTMAAAVNQDTSTMSYIGYLYRCGKGSFGRAVWDDVISTYNE